jgi:flagellar basal body rod protein FlgC
MQITPAINSSVFGMTDASRRFDTSAENVATGEGDLATELVEGTMLAPAAYSANAAMFRAADDTRGYVLDVLAR